MLLETSSIWWSHVENSTLLIGSLIERGGLTTISVDTVFVPRQLILKFISWTKSGVVGLWSRIWVIMFFFLGKDSSFSVLATEFSKCKGNCIYFTDENDIGVFYFENQKTGKIVDFQDRCHLFWPPPSWLSSKSSSKC